MRWFIHLSLSGLLAFVLIAATGCQDSGTASVAQPVATHGDHDHDHDGHDHDGHDHDGHDHDGHDHDGHDHDGHDHDGHDHDGHDHDGHDHDGGHDEHAHDGEHKHPQTYDEAVTALVEMHKTIAEAFAADKVDDAHGPLHDVGHMLEDTESMIEKSDMDGDTKKKLNEAIEQLFTSYGAVDEKLHDETEGKDYSDVAQQIEDAINALKAQSTVAKE